MALDKYRTPPRRDHIPKLLAIVSTSGPSDARNCVKRWFAVGLGDRSQFPSSFRLHQKNNGNLSLINTELAGRENSRAERTRVSEYIAENVTPDLISSFPRIDMEDHGVEAVNRTLLARFGEIIFRMYESITSVFSSPSEKTKKDTKNDGVEPAEPALVARFGNIVFSSSPESLPEALDSQHSLIKLKRLLDTNVPRPCVPNIIKEARNIGLQKNVEKSKIRYIVQLRDSSRPDAKIFCKCKKPTKKDPKLEVLKVECNERLNYMVIDVSCLEENVDLRLQIETKRKLACDLTDNDMRDIQDIIDAAIIEPQIGGLKWPNGNEAFGDKFTVIQSCRIMTETYVNSSMTFKIRICYRMEFGKSTGELSREVTGNLKKVTSELKERADKNLIREMLKDDLTCLFELLPR